MPSTHSASTIYFAVYISLYIASSTRTLTVPLTLFITILLIAALSVVWSRVELGHHTRGQVIAGTMVGCLCARLWHSLWWEYALPLSVDLGLNKRLGVHEIGIVVGYVWDVFREHVTAEKQNKDITSEGGANEASIQYKHLKEHEVKNQLPKERRQKSMDGHSFNE
ncbi:9977_t:CDS:2 [Paraglomus occultum]|uniref:9977_t:CDS:1 n=1 Tax=Paraglomus occultum TaxID=144539 RepID=A0A9N9C5X9_9GLOM|nr:9977_t:CDS:2 [Paraglomus occultum]